jgi:hypothetical protein
MKFHTYTGTVVGNRPDEKSTHNQIMELMNATKNTHRLDNFLAASKDGIRLKGEKIKSGPVR